MTDDAPLSAIEIPFPAAINPLTHRAQEHTRDWAYRFGLIRGAAAVRRFARLRSGYLAGRVYPRARFDELALVTDWISWVFRLDDQLDELPPRLVTTTAQELPGRLMAVVGPGEPGEQFADTSVSQALANLWRRTTRLTSPQWQQRCASDLIDYLRWLRQEASDRSPQRMPEVESRIAARRRSSGMFLALDMIEAAERVDVAADLAATAEYQALREATNDVVAWTSDLASHAKDVARGDVNNLVVVLQHQQRCSTGAAIRHATEIIHERIDDFLAAKRALPAACIGLLAGSAGCDGLRRVVAGCEFWMRGNRDWSLETERYVRIQRTRAAGRPNPIEPPRDPGHR